MLSFRKTLYTVSAEFVVGIIVQKSPGISTRGFFILYFIVGRLCFSNCC